jgi:hypothetical protein
VAVTITPPTATVGYEERRAEFRTAAQAAIRFFAQAIGAAAQDSSSGEVRTEAIAAIKRTAKHYYGVASQHMKDFVPPLVLAVKDINIQVRRIASLLDG